VIDARNIASQRALKKAGFRKEGTMRKALWDAEGNWADTDLYGILREEWKKPKMSTKVYATE